MSIISSVMIKLKGDSTGAVKALDDVQDEAKKAEKALQSMDAVKTAGLGAAAAGLAAVAVAAGAASQAVAAYAETNQGAADTLSGLSEGFNGMMESIGGAIFESDGFQRVMVTVSNVMNIVKANSEAIGNVISTVLSVAISGVVAVIDGAITAWHALKAAQVAFELVLHTVVAAFENMRLLLSQVSLAVIDLGLAFGQGLSGALQGAIDKMVTFIRFAEPLASYAGIDLSGAIATLEGYSAGVGGATDSLVAMRASIAAVAEQVRADRQNNIDQLADRYAEGAEDLVNIWGQYNDALETTTGLTEGTTEALEASGRAARRSTGSVAALAAELNKLVQEQIALNEARKVASESAAAERAANEAGKVAAGAAAIEAQRRAAEEAKYAEDEARIVRQQEQQEQLAQSLAEQRERELEAEREHFAQRAAIRQSYLDVVASTGQSMIALGTSLYQANQSAEEGAVKAMAKSAAEALKIQAITQGALGLLNLIPPPWNPFGNPAAGKAQIAGAAAAGAQSAILYQIAKASPGASGTGDTKQPGLSATGNGSAPIGGSSSKGTSVTYNNQISFGLVGDQRAAAGLVLNALQFAQTEGMVR